MLFSLIWAVPAAMAVQAPVTDSEITDAVEDELLVDEVVPFDEIDVTTRDGIVTLTGNVKHLLAKDRAVRIAETVRGVKAVVDKMAVVPPVGRTDRQIEADIREALLFNPSTEAYEIGVTVDVFKATLTGTVESWREKMTAEKVVKGVRGVAGVDNRIEVQGDPGRSDEAIEADVEQALKWDVLVDDELIDVEVRNGTVRLAGVVGSAAEKGMAINNAFVTGAIEVDAAELTVEPWAENADLRKRKLTVPSDADIQAAVERALLYDQRVGAHRVKVKVKAGFVTLKGTVENLLARRAAGQDAQNTVGVLGVRNHLKIRPEADIDDEKTADRIREAFLRDPLLSLYRIDLRVADGVAYIDGSVDSYYEKKLAENIASTARGIKRVVNELEVYNAADVFGYDPYVDEFAARDYAWVDYAGGTASDLTIEENIENQLFWSPFVESETINVEVNDGTAILTGNVDTRAQKSMAEANAYEGGARRVVNNLNLR
jgi:osmotically-inducible protein OsmY